MSSNELNEPKKVVEPAEVKVKNTGGVQSLEIGLSILDILINHNEPMMLKDIAKAMQMHPAKIHRYLVSLIRKEFASQTSDGRYGIGLRVNTLGHAGLNQNNILERLNQVGMEIRDILNCGVQIAKWFNEGPIVIQSIEPNSPISIITRIGSRMPLSTSATGRLFASYQPSEMIKPLILAEWSLAEGQTNLMMPCATEDGHTPEWLEQKWQAFRPMREEIQQQGYAAVTGDMLIGVSAISVPIALTSLMTEKENSILEYAVTVIGTIEQLPTTLHLDIIRDIQSIAIRYQVI